MSDSKLVVYQSGREVHFKLTLTAIGSWFIFSCDAGSEWAAKLLVQAIQRQLEAGMEEARRQAYAEGWRDAKAKKAAKQIWFSGRLP